MSRADYIEAGGDHHPQCLHPERWARVEAALNRIEEKFDHHHKRMFVDNGTPSIQSRLTAGDAKFGELETRLATIEAYPANAIKTAGILATIFAALLGGIIWLIKHA